MCVCVRAHAHAEALKAQSLVDSRLIKFVSPPPPGSLCCGLFLLLPLRLLFFFSHSPHQRQAKYSENKLKSVKARNEYLLTLEASNASVFKYYIHDLSDLIDVSTLSPPHSLLPPPFLGRLRPLNGPVCLLRFASEVKSGMQTGIRSRICDVPFGADSGGGGGRRLQTTEFAVLICTKAAFQPDVSLFLQLPDIFMLLGRFFSIL